MEAGRRKDRQKFLNTTKVVLVSGRMAEGEEEIFKGDQEDLVDFEMHEQIDQWVARQAPMTLPSSQV